LNYKMNEFSFQTLRDLAADSVKEALEVVKDETLNYKGYGIRITALNHQPKSYPLFVKVKIDFSYSGDSRPNSSIFVDVSSVKGLESCVDERIRWLNIVNKRNADKK